MSWTHRGNIFGETKEWNNDRCGLPLSISLPLYILSDNEQPLDCAWGCDSFVDNTTTIIAADSGINCNVKANSGMRLGLMIVTGLFVVLSGILLRCDKKIED